MNLKNVYLSLLILCTSCAIAQKDSIIYPIAPEDNTTDTFFSTVVKDPFRPLEYDSHDRNEWLQQEAAITDKYYRKTHNKVAIESAFESLSQYSNNLASRSGPYYLRFYRGPDDVVTVQYTKELMNENEYDNLLFDPTWVSQKLKGASNYRVSEDGQYLAFMYSFDNSDWHEIGVYNIKTEKLLSDHIQNVRYSDIDWRGDGFYYTRFDSVNKSRKYTDVPSYPKVYYHKVGDSVNSDSLICQNQSEPLNFFHVQVFGHERYVAISELHHTTQSQTLHFLDTKDNNGWKEINIKAGYEFQFIGGDSPYVYAQTTYPDAYNGAIVEIDPKDLHHWETVVPNQKTGFIRQAIYRDHRIYTVFEREFLQSILIFSDSGKMLKKIARPYGSSTNIISYCPEKKGFIISRNYFFCPPIGEFLSLKNDSVTLISKTKVLFDAMKFEINISTYLSYDSTPIPIYIVRNLEYKGPRPTLLEVYGGFGITPPPSFDPGVILFLNSGGTFAYANVRGGKEHIKGWHTDGTLLKKQNTFEDTYYAARFLVTNKFAERSKLALTGGSNGGLVCAAVVNQHPDCFKAVISHVGVYDVLRMEKFTVGAYHNVAEFGSVSNPVLFPKLLSYSPLHNIRPNTQYPAMLILTGDHDDRVPPLHTFKYVAAMQKYTQGKRPILMILEKNAGHHGSGSFEGLAIKNKLAYSFLLKELDMEFSSEGIY